MADSKIAIQQTIANEGGYQNDPVDAGNWLNGTNFGTKWGITPHTLQAYFPQLLSNPYCVRDLDMSTAISCYQQGYWKPLYSEINDQSMANKLFDMGVLFGVGTATKMLQISLTPSGQILSVPDGVFGPITLAQVNDHGSLAACKTAMYRHCMDVVNNRPEDAKYLTGWTRRIQS
jgi:lysozyme family protein